MSTPLKIDNVTPNNVGTIDFLGKFNGMKKAQDFTVYPLQKTGERLTIQSDTRFGFIHLSSGEVVLGAPKATGSNFAHFSTNKKTHGTLSPAECQKLRDAMKRQGGAEVGSSILKVNNSGALDL
jgi:hypothetical protein